MVATPLYFFHTKPYGNIPNSTPSLGGPRRKFRRGPPNEGVECRLGMKKITIFDQKISLNFVFSTWCDRRVPPDRGRLLTV